MASARRVVVYPTFVARDSKITHEPPAVTLGAPLGPLPGSPPRLLDASRRRGGPPSRIVAAATCACPAVRTRSEAVVVKATTEPSTLLAGAPDAPAPALPSPSAET